MFFGEEDLWALSRSAAEASAREEGRVVELLPDAHLILTPRTSDGLGRALGKAHPRGLRG